MSNSTVFDPLRKKDIALTEEEKVRQWFISILNEGCKVPYHMMMSEVGMKYGAEGKIFRADIVVYRRDMSPAAIVECKRPDVELTEKVLEQALRYSMVLPSRYFILTNGKSTLAAEKKDGRIAMIDKIPEYSELCQQ